MTLLVTSTREVEARQYEVNVGNQTYYVRTSGNANAAAGKALTAIQNGQVGAGCANVSAGVPSWWDDDPERKVNPDVCPNIGGHQSAVPENHRLIGGNCVVDKCVNITGFQEAIPEGLRDVGGRICQINNQFNVFCRVNPSPTAPDRDVTFVAAPFYQAQGDITYVWYRGGQATGERLRTQTTDDTSSVTLRFPNEGSERVTVAATDSNGNRTTKTCAVSVVEGGVFTDTTADGDSGEDGATLELTSDKALTNDTCDLTWRTSNVVECFLTSTEGMNEKVDLNGTRTVDPGTYFLRCLSQQINILQSAEQICRLNPDVREI